MSFRNIYKNSWVCLDKFMFIIICIKTSQCRNFSFQSTFTIGFCFITIFIYFKIFLIFLDIYSFKLIQNINGKIFHGIVLKGRIFIQEKLKKDSDIIRIGNSCFGSSKRIHSTKIILAEIRQCFQNSSKLQNI